MRFFINYSDYKIELANPNLIFLVIISIILFLIIFTSKKGRNNFFDYDTAQAFRGIAIIFLIMGHISQKVLKEKMFFNSGGYWAVMIFLFISGYGIYIKYGFKKIDNEFWKKRFRRLYIPLWITLFLFIFLDYQLISLRHPWEEIIFIFLGGHFDGALFRVNSSAWFITYILYLYLLYYTITILPINDSQKILLLFSSLFTIDIIIKFTQLNNYIGIWKQYTFVFPAGVLLAYYQSTKGTFLKNIQKNNHALILIIIISLFIFYNWPSYRIFRSIPFLFALIMALLIFEKINWQSKALIFLGNYSYEIYLLHAPFMVKYDFFLFRQPFIASFFVYCMFLVLLSLLLKKTSFYFQTKVFAQTGMGKPAT